MKANVAFYKLPNVTDFGSKKMGMMKKEKKINPMKSPHTEPTSFLSSPSLLPFSKISNSRMKGKRKQFSYTMAGIDEALNVVKISNKMTV